MVLQEEALDSLLTHYIVKPAVHKSGMDLRAQNGEVQVADGTRLIEAVELLVISRKINIGTNKVNNIMTAVAIIIRLTRGIIKLKSQVITINFEQLAVCFLCSCRGRSTITISP